MAKQKYNNVPRTSGPKERACSPSHTGLPGTGQDLLSGSQMIFLGDLTFSPHLTTISSARNKRNNLDGSYHPKSMITKWSCIQRTVKIAVVLKGLKYFYWKPVWQVEGCGSNKTIEPPGQAIDSLKLVNLPFVMSFYMNCILRLCLLFRRMFVLF